MCCFVLQATQKLVESMLNLCRAKIRGGKIKPGIGYIRTWTCLNDWEAIGKEIHLIQEQLVLPLFSFFRSITHIGITNSTFRFALSHLPKPLFSVLATLGTKLHTYCNDITTIENSCQVPMNICMALVAIIHIDKDWVYGKTHHEKTVPDFVRARVNWAPQKTLVTSCPISFSMTLGVLQPSLPPRPSFP